MGCIYRATNIVNGKIYIGKTIHNLEHRKQAHLAEALRVNHAKKPFIRALMKYGANSFVWDIIEDANDNTYLCQMEQVYIQKFNSLVPTGYNATIGGEGVTGMHHSDASIEVMRQRKLGKSFSDERKQKMREYQRKAVRKTDRVVCNKDTGVVYGNSGVAARSLGIDNGKAIYRACLSKNGKAHGYGWEFVGNGIKSGTFIPPKKAVRCVETGCIYESSLDASLALGLDKNTRSTIACCCRGKSETAHGFHWEYIDGSGKKYISTKHENNLKKSAEKRKRPIRNKDTGRVYACVTDITKDLNLDIQTRRNIIACCRGKPKTAYGFRWEYADLVESS